MRGCECLHLMGGVDPDPDSCPLPGEEWVEGYWLHSDCARAWDYVSRGMGSQ